MSRVPIVAGNWKMHGSRAGGIRLAEGIRLGFADGIFPDLVLCPPSVYLDCLSETLRESNIGLGAQDLSEQESAGAFTGELHGSMLVDVGCRYVIVGHSERRLLFGESDGLVAHKFATAQACGLIPILCIGEKLEEREEGITKRVLARQLGAVIERCGADAMKEAVIAYEPVWAIGTGRTASPELAQETHAFLRSHLTAMDATLANSMRLLYGGSVKPDNAAALFSCPDVDGGLIGGASLNASDFLAIAAAYPDNK